MHDPDARFDELLDLIYDAALNPDSWLKFLSALKGALSGGGGFLFSQDIRNNHVIAEAVGVDASWMEAYNSHYAATNLWVRKAADWPAGSLMLSHEMVDERSFEASEWYNDGLRRAELYHGIGHIVQRSPNALTILSVLRAEQAGIFNPAEIRLLERLAPHVRRALQMHQHLFDLRMQAEGTASGFDQLCVGTVIATQDGRVISANRMAEQLLRKGEGIAVWQGRLAGRTHRATEALLNEIRQAGATANRQGHSPGGVWVSPLPDGNSLSVLVCPLRVSAPLRDSMGAVLLLIADPRRDIAVRQRALSDLYHLTQAEARLANALVHGERLSEYADRMRLSINTVKTHLKNLFDKTGASRQSELIRLLVANPAAVRREDF